MNVRRPALFIKESIFGGTQWVVYEHNGEPLWAQICLNVGAFMHDLFRQGAFQGSSAHGAFFVRCGQETITQGQIDPGIVNIAVGFAPLKPAEFAILWIVYGLANGQFNVKSFSHRCRRCHAQAN